MPRRGGATACGGLGRRGKLLREVLPGVPAAKVLSKGRGSGAGAGGGTGSPAAHGAVEFSELRSSTRISSPDATHQLVLREEALFGARPIRGQSELRRHWEVAVATPEGCGASTLANLPSPLILDQAITAPAEVHMCGGEIGIAPGFATPSSRSGCEAASSISRSRHAANLAPPKAVWGIRSGRCQDKMRTAATQIEDVQDFCHDVRRARRGERPPGRCGRVFHGAARWCEETRASFAPTTPSHHHPPTLSRGVRAGSCMSAAVLGTAVGPLTASSGVSLVLTRALHAA